MKLEEFNPDDSTIYLENIASKAFSGSEDSDISEWFSFEEMLNSIKIGRGVCLSCFTKDGGTVGFIYAQQENPINGREGVEKWVIIITAVDPSVSRSGIGTMLLDGIEKIARTRKVCKMFVSTNQNDNGVIGFYHKNGYSDAGYIRDYQHGKDNSAIFLLKYL